MIENPEARSQEPGGRGQGPEDRALGRVIRGAVADDLERQRGGAAAAFWQHIEENRDSSGGSESTRVPMIWRLKLWAGAASLLAASLAIVVTLQLWHRPVTPGMPAGPLVSIGAPSVPAATPEAAPVVDQFVWTRNVDGGPAVLDDDTPVRVIRQQTLRKTQWTDQKDNATYSVTEPIEKVGYVRVQPY